VRGLRTDGEMKNVYRIMVEESEGKREFRRYKHRGEEYISVWNGFMWLL
jgi:hypothetical protein